MDAPALYQSLVLGVVFGAKRMFEGFKSSGVRVGKVLCAGGVAKKAPYVMQTLATVLDREVGVSASDEACAKGSAMFAACAAGLYPSLPECQEALCDGTTERYRPDAGRREEYSRLYGQYLLAGEFMDRLAERT